MDRPVPRTIPEHFRESAVPICDHELGHAVGFLSVSMGNYAVFDLNGAFITSREKPLRSPPVSPIEMAAGGLVSIGESVAVVWIAGTVKWLIYSAAEQALEYLEGPVEENLIRRLLDDSIPLLRRSYRGSSERTGL